MQSPQKTKAKQHATRRQLPRRRKGGTTSEFSTLASPACEGALSERLVPPFLQSVHSPASITSPKPLVFTKPRLTPPFPQNAPTTK